MTAKNFDWNQKGDKLNEVTTKKYQRIEKSEGGLALIALLEGAGGNTALARALNIDTRTVNTWCHRGQISQQGAYKVARTMKGWTKEMVRPDLLPNQWEGEKKNAFGTFLRATKEDIAESQRRYQERMEKARTKVRNKQLEKDLELLERINHPHEG